MFLFYPGYPLRSFKIKECTNLILLIPVASNCVSSALGLRFMFLSTSLPIHDLRSLYLPSNTNGI